MVWLLWGSFSGVIYQSILNSKGTTHVSPLRTSHEVSVMRVLLRCNTLIRIWTHNGHPMYCPYGRANVCLCWGVMTLNINQIMNSLMMPHVSPRWMSHGVSVVMILVNIDNVMQGSKLRGAEGQNAPKLSPNAPRLLNLGAKFCYPIQPDICFEA